jgi:hypothetical protein
METYSCTSATARYAHSSSSIHLGAAASIETLLKQAAGRLKQQQCAHQEQQENTCQQ